MQNKAKCAAVALNPHSELPMYCDLDWDHEGRHEGRNRAHSWDGDDMHCDHIDREKGAISAEAEN